MKVGYEKATEIVRREKLIFCIKWISVAVDISSYFIMNIFGEQ